MDRAGPRLVAVCRRLAGVITLYSLRFVAGAAVDRRRPAPVVLAGDAAPGRRSPAVQAIDPPPMTEPPALEGATKRARLAWWYEQDPAYGDRSTVAAAAKRLAPLVGLGEGTARAYIGQIVAALEAEGRAS